MDVQSGGDYPAVKAAGERLIRVGNSSSASAGQVEGPLQTIEAWCTTSASGPVLADGDPGPDVPDTPGGLQAALGCENLNPSLIEGLGAGLELAVISGVNGDVPAGMTAYSYCGYGPPPQPGGEVTAGFEYAIFDTPEAAQAWLASVVADVGAEGVPVSTRRADGEGRAAAAWSGTTAVWVTANADGPASDAQLAEVAGFLTNQGE